MSMNLARSSEVERGGFIISKIKGAVIDNKLNPDQIMDIFYGDGSLAGDFFGSAIAQYLAKHGEEVFLIFNDKEELDHLE